MLFARQGLTAAVMAALSFSQAAAQTWTTCNPLTTTCPAKTALGMTVNVDFTKGGVNSFVASGGGTVNYDSNGATFTVSKSGDAPQLASVFYIMFGRVEMTFKAAHGAGIVSSFVLQSDCLDEIDWEWLGADAHEVQTNYFGKGLTTSYNRGAFHKTPENQATFHTYVVDWNADRIVWTVDGTIVRQLGFNDAEKGQYPQTPMQVKFGAWSGGDPSNPQGTIDWSRGPTDYSKGPFSMNVKKIKVTDYSTGTKYSYGDMTGNWQSIKAEGGKVNGNLNGAGALTTTAVATGTNASPTTAGKPSVPAGGVGGDTTAGSSQYNLPPGWFMTSDGKIMPIGAAAGVVPPHVAIVSVFTVVASLVSLGRFFV
ncbi:concanavalin A-like lectin/glucanase domain-containing protein [Microdochium bolleyi]|uniref:Crh-like protein n=1 Tax=Microdochium bolleyi TaxID=196109 RepID=A0A136J2Z4_9PEZI|nr:concanavalin A-like lectin/glucanase domain-containing protein [Microdochium bolleyi]